MSNYGQHFSTQQTVQTEPIPGKDMGENLAGGYAFKIDKWARLQRFLILGAEGTYYASGQAMTIDNANVVVDCIREDGRRVVDSIVTTSQEGRAPKNDSALFALLMCMTPDFANLATRQAAFAALPAVARIGTHLFKFCSEVDSMRGWGRGLRRALSRWYNSKAPARLAYQVVKYQQRHGWTHRDVLRKAHPVPLSDAHKIIYHYITQKELPCSLAQTEGGVDMLYAFESIKRAESVNQATQLIREFRLPREAVPTRFLNDSAIWQALLESMPMTAMIRNLAKMTSIGLLAPLSFAANFVVKQLGNADYLRRARVHPFSVFLALRTYAMGCGIRGKLRWEPVPAIVDALDKAFYLCFDNVEPTGKRIVIGVDVSGSMSAPILADPNTQFMVPGPPSVLEAAAAIALVTNAVEPNSTIVAFSHDIVPITITPRQRIDNLCNELRGLPMGNTDCALPMLWALGYAPDVRGGIHRWFRHPCDYKKVRDNVIEADVFIVITDNETWFGKIHPVQALNKYRKQTGIDAKLVVLAMTSTGFSIADPNDSGMLDICGMDSAVPTLISDFISGRV